MRETTAVKTSSSGLATAALITGLLSFLCAPVGPIAIVLGIAALASIGRDPTRTGKGSATAGILCGFAGTFILGVSSFLVFKAMHMMDRAEDRLLLKLTGVVEHVVETYPDAHVLVIRDTYDPEKTQKIDEQLARLPNVTTHVRSAGEYGLDMIESAELDAIIADHPEATHLFMLGTLPMEASDFAYFTDDRESRPKMILYDSQLWGLDPYLSEDYIVAAAMNQLSPDYDPDAPRPADIREAWELQFLLVTPENAAEIVAEFPEFFGNNYDIDDRDPHADYYFNKSHGRDATDTGTATDTAETGTDAGDDAPDTNEDGANTPE